MNENADLISNAADCYKQSPEITSSLYQPLSAKNYHMIYFVWVMIKNNLRSEKNVSVCVMPGILGDRFFSRPTF